MRKGIAAAALVAVLALAGCGGSGVELDREVEVGGMTLSVPSIWVEKGGENENESLGYAFGYIGYVVDPEDASAGGIYVSYSNTGLDETPEDNLSEGSVLVDEMVIDGVQTEVYERTYESLATGEEITESEAYIYSREMHYTITVSGSDVSIDDVLETVDLD